MTVQTESVIAVIERRCQRSISAILALVDEIDDAATHQRVRKAVLDELNEFRTLSAKLVESVSCDHIVLNDYYLEMLEQIAAKLDA